MERDRRPRHRELGRQLAHRPRAGLEEVHDRPSGAVPKRVENVVAPMQIGGSESVSCH